MPVLALGAVDLVILIVGVFALLILLAAWVGMKPLQAVANAVGWPISLLAGAISHFLGWAMKQIAQGLDSLVHATGHLIWAAGVGLWHWVYQVTQALVNAYAAVGHALAVAYQEGQAAIGWAQNAIAGAMSTVQGWVNAAETAAATDSAQALATAEAGIAAAESQAQSLFSTAEAGISSVAADVISEAAAVLGTAEAFATGLADDVRSLAVDLFGQAEAGIQAVGGDVQALAGTISGEISGIESQLGSMQGALGALATIPLLQSLVNSLATEADTCLKPLCDTVTPRAPQLGKLGQFLAGIEDLAIDALVAALFVEAVTHPGAVASEAETLIRAVGEPVVTGIRDLTGL